MSNLKSILKRTWLLSSRHFQLDAQCWKRTATSWGIHQSWTNSNIILQMMERKHLIIDHPVFWQKTRRRQNKTRSGDVRGQNGSKKHGTHHNFPLINGNFGVCQPFSDRPKYRHEQITSMGHHQQGITYENQSNMRELCMCICFFEHNSDSSLMSLTGRG